MAAVRFRSGFPADASRFVGGHDGGAHPRPGLRAAVTEPNVHNDRETNRILGAALLLGTQASESIAVIQMAMLAGLEYTAVRDAIITHPTMAEGLTLLFTPAYPED
ncbi:hypothetical protein J2X01_002425 [Arthrobacter ginsengisoli]|uniref:Pyridine nucleotide-disulphide oxidoreductase dimerisation domain-containing protein n=1 Tax=Arthrobacter ginsengisoli TaxID=1356565 RepID=A0ABU1UD71_9MICC|nr:hypothetical protein [Arthrobacter ginsengisoli]MDR7083132.1 hypothetical protein [Arthrobacter ginsengisoli]